jgi:predicted esterase
MRAVLSLTVSLLLACSAVAQYEPPAATPPPADLLKAIAERTEKLGKQLGQLRQQGVRDPVLAEVEIYHKAAVWIVRHGEWYQKDAGQWTLDVLDRGLLRASQAARGEAPWFNQTGRSVVRAYRSGVDGSVQPYAVTFPAEYGKGQPKRWRLDVVLHGRNSSLTEVSFLKSHDGGRAAARDQSWVQIDIFGRTNNAYRWAGETDVFEAIDAFLTVEQGLGRGALIDQTRTILRGFSMGGAGTWHIGLQHPGRWCAINPGAGFTTTHGYVKGLPAQLPSYVEKCLSIYDAVEYAENAAMVPVIAYSGGDDPQKAAADNIERKLKMLGIPMTHIVAPGLGHKFPPEWQAKVEVEFAKYLKTGRPDYLPRVRFVTWTLRYDRCDWVQILGLDEHYRRSLVDAVAGDEGFTVKTENIRALSFRLRPGATRQPAKVQIDGQQLEVVPYQQTRTPDLFVYLEKRDGKWHGVLPERLAIDRLRRPQKAQGLTGPIDDAFVTGFLCVRGTGRPWHEGTGQYADADLERFRREWSRYLRGDLPIKDDVDVTPEDIATKNLVLFGDPSSNALLAQVLPGLPLTWTREKIALDGQTFAAGEHVPAMIYPSPLTTNRYVVLNSGHTFHAADFRGTNALLYPRLGDYAVFKRMPRENDPLAVEIARAGLFDDHWQLRGQR